MAKKVIATLQKTGKDLVKLITCPRSKKTNAYTFKEEMITLEQAQKVVQAGKK